MGEKNPPVSWKAGAHTPYFDSKLMASSTNPGLLFDLDLFRWSSEIVRAFSNLVNVQKQCLSFILIMGQSHDFFFFFSIM